MTAQIEDKFSYRNQTFTLSGISDGELFNPNSLGLEPKETWTNCYRGFQAVYALLGNKLVLSDLRMSLYQDEGQYKTFVGPAINGVTPQRLNKENKMGIFNNFYYNINLHILYTGGLLVTDGFIRNLYDHMGFQSAWKYKTVIELTFENGLLSQEIDRSRVIGEIRDFIVSSSKNEELSFKQTKKEIREYVESSFNRSYSDLKSIFEDFL